ncbi:hypothetical protein [Oligoflexus tunisiensis]|uniref:hypothetical protein n=1 Tax=Oligoflexus tunisiensis TaxID=708132 RepID=UPI00114CC0E8|nr:hypothetical protein [Oligoflexus tunisiensis]
MRLWHLLPLLLLHTAAVEAVVTPKLDRVRVRINDSEKDVSRKDRLELIRGDDLTLLYAVLEGQAKGAETINFVGYRGEGPRRWQDDDRGILIPTSELGKGWSLDKSGTLYRIETRTGQKVHGEVLVSLLTPELQTLTLNVKGVERQLKDGDVVDMAADDPIKVVSVRTNSPVVDASVRVEFKEIKSDANRQVELRLLYRSYAFASVYLHTVAK